MLVYCNGLSFWLTSLCIMGSSFIHLIRTDWNEFFFNGWVIFHSVYVPQLPYPFICWWASRLLPCPGYYKQLHSAFFIVQLSHPYMTTGKAIALTRRTFVDKVMPLLFNMLFRLIITFLPMSKHLLISWLQSQSAMICFLLLSCMSSLYTVNITPLSGICFTNIFSHSVDCLFSLLMVSFAVHKLLFLM